MKHPARASVLVFVAVIVVTAAIIAVVGFGTDGATAIEVGDEKVSREALNDELRTWADFEPDAARTTAAAVDARFAAQIASQSVYDLLAREYLARTGEQVTAADRASAREQTQAPRFDDLPEWYQETVLDRFAVFAAITRLEGDPADPNAELVALRAEAKRAGVRVDPAYGRWSQQTVAVVPFTLPAELATQP